MGDRDLNNQYNVAFSRAQKARSKGSYDYCDAVQDAEVKILEEVQDPQPKTTHDAPDTKSDIAAKTIKKSDANAVLSSTSIRNRKKNEDRKHRRIVPMESESLQEIPSGIMTPEQAVLDKEKRELLCEALARLPQYERDLIWFRYVEGVSYEEIAKCLKIKKKTAVVRVYRAKLKLKKLFPMPLLDD